VIAAQPPEQAAWIAPLTRLAPVAYTVLGFAEPQERSSGVGAALAGRLQDVAVGAPCASARAGCRLSRASS
jgi:hypothetical protein